MKQVELRLHFEPGPGLLVGRMAEADRRLYVEFDPAFLARGLPLSPFKLPLRAGAMEHRDQGFGPLPGVFDDSLPDGWGRLLMDRQFRQQGLEPKAVSVLDRLLWLGTRTMGALGYHPAEAARPAQPLDLRRMWRHASEVHAGVATEVLPQLLRAGGSPGGARPKLLVGLRGEELLSGEESLPEGFEHWLVKFAAAEELADAGPLEQAYAVMARAAGIDLPPTRLIALSPRRRCFAVQRFDRLPGNRRLHMHSLAGLVHADFRVPSLDYADLLRVTLALTRHHQEMLRAFRLMLFNLAAHNRDDHGKNFAFLMDPTGAWKLAPAFDLVFSHGPGGEHSTTLAGAGRDPGMSQVQALARQFGVRPRELEALREAVNSAVARWRVIADEAGCARRASAAVARHLRAV